MMVHDCDGSANKGQNRTFSHVHWNLQDSRFENLPSSINFLRHHNLESHASSFKTYRVNAIFLLHDLNDEGLQNIHQLALVLSPSSNLLDQPSSCPMLCTSNPALVKPTEPLATGRLEIEILRAQLGLTILHLILRQVDSICITSSV